jgi:hypothetical protein
MRKTTMRKTAIGLLVTAALVVPASASAATADQFLPSSAGPAEQAQSGAPAVVQTRTVEAGSSGFDWEDAGLGAAGMLSLLVLAAGGVAIGRRARKPAPIG